MKNDHLEEIKVFLKSAESVLDKSILDKQEVQSLSKAADTLIEKIGHSRSYFKRLL